MANDLGERLFELKFKMGAITSYGGPEVPLLLSGKVKPPVPGAALDVVFEGTFQGPRLRGTVHNGIDRIYIGPDGQTRLLLLATFKTEDGANLAFHSDGWVAYRDGKVLVRQTARLSTLVEPYLWVNGHVVWIAGEANLAERTVELSAFIP